MTSLTVPESSLQLAYMKLDHHTKEKDTYLQYG